MGANWNHKAIGEFGALVMKHVRDPQCDLVLQLLSGSSLAGADRSSAGKYGQLHLTDKQQTFVQEFLSEAIDSAARACLYLLDNREIEVWFKSESGETIDVREASDGLHGEYGCASDPSVIGWIQQFSEYDDRLQRTPKE